MLGLPKEGTSGPNCCMLLAISGNWIRYRCSVVRRDQGRWVGGDVTSHGLTHSTRPVQICFGNPSEVAVSTGRRQVEPQDGGSRMGIGVMCWRISPGFPFNLFSLYFDLFFCCSARGIVCYVDWTRSMSRSEQAVWRIRGKPKPYGNHGLSDTGTEIF